MAYEDLVITGVLKLVSKLWVSIELAIAGCSPIRNSTAAGNRLSLQSEFPSD